jgi:DNA-binding transcriptional LysR family regulator
MLDVRRMRVLREVAARGSFSAAAEALNFTQSAVSQHVAALERESGAKLVERGARGVRLTVAGRALVDHTDAILARIGAAEEELAAIAGLRGGRLRLACFQSAGATLVPRAVAVFHGRHPGVELGMVEAEPAAAGALLRSGEIDLALVYDHDSVPAMLEPELELTPLVDDRYDAILPRDHRLARRRRLALSDLAEDPWIASRHSGGCRQITEQVCRDAGFEPRVAFEADETLAAQALVAAGVGVTILPRLALTVVHPEVVTRALSDAPVRRVWAARAASAYRSPASEAMMQILSDVAEEFREAKLELAKTAG